MEVCRQRSCRRCGGLLRMSNKASSSTSAPAPRNGPWRQHNCAVPSSRVIETSSDCSSVQLPGAACRRGDLLGDLRRLLGQAFDGWVDATADAADSRHEAAVAELQRCLAASQAENARLAADNARFARLIDIPDWGAHIPLHRCL